MFFFSPKPLVEISPSLSVRVPRCRMRGVGSYLTPSSGSHNPEILERKSVRNVCLSPAQRLPKGREPVLPSLVRLHLVMEGTHCPEKQTRLCSENVSQDRTLYICLLKQGWWRALQSSVHSLGDFQQIDLFNENVWADRPHSNGM